MRPARSCVARWRVGRARVVSMSGAAAVDRCRAGRAVFRCERRKPAGRGYAAATMRRRSGRRRSVARGDPGLHAPSRAARSSWLAGPAGTASLESSRRPRFRRSLLPGRPVGPARSPAGQARSSAGPAAARSLAGSATSVAHGPTVTVQDRDCGGRAGGSTMEPQPQPLGTHDAGPAAACRAAVICPQRRDCSSGRRPGACCRHSASSCRGLSVLFVCLIRLQPAELWRPIIPRAVCPICILWFV